MSADAAILYDGQGGGGYTQSANTGAAANYGHIRDCRGRYYSRNCTWTTSTQDGRANTTRNDTGQWYDKYGVAALQGWYRTRLIPQIWSLFEGTKKVDTHQLNIEIDMQVWAVSKGAELNRGIVLAKGNR